MLGMNGLLPDELTNRLPGIGSDLETPLRDTVVEACFRDSLSGWKWYVLEFDGVDTFFGIIVTGAVAVPGQFTLSELQAIGGDDTAGEESKVLLDDNFSPCSVGELAQIESAVDEVIAILSPRETNLNQSLVDLEL